jgi:hypothetical protein
MEFSAGLLDSEEALPSHSEEELPVLVSLELAIAKHKRAAEQGHCLSKQCSCLVWPATTAEWKVKPICQKCKVETYGSGAI